MALTVKVVFVKYNKTYCFGEDICGHIIIESKNETKHDGIFVLLEHILSIRPPLNSIGLLDNLVSVTKSSTIFSKTEIVAKPGKLQAGVNKVDFSIKVENHTMHETYHGLCIDIKYTFKCEIKRHTLSNSQSHFEITVERMHCKRPDDKLNKFVLKSETLTKTREIIHTPKFLIEGHFDSKEFLLTKAITGEFSVIKCDRAISSIDLQLMRIETLKDQNIREVSEVQTIQMCFGDVARGIMIPIHMVLPRWITCEPVTAPNFTIEFQMNFVVTFDNDHTATETFPISFIR